MPLIVATMCTDSLKSSYGGNVPLPLKSAKKEEGKVLDYSGSEKVEIVDLCHIVGLYFTHFHSKFYLILLLPLSI